MTELLTLQPEETSLWRVESLALVIVKPLSFSNDEKDKEKGEHVEYAYAQKGVLLPKDVVIKEVRHSCRVENRPELEDRRAD